MSQKIEFQVAGDKVTGHWHFPSDGTAPWPLVLMGHGFAALWHFGTGPSIEAFNNAGFAVFTFDYRHFGDSEGQPRQLISVPKQLDDWRAALQQVRGDSRIDAARIALWGSSFGGGHALSIAAEATDVAAVISQVPHCDSRGLFKTLPVAISLKTMGHVLLDQLYSLVGKVHTLPDAHFGQRPLNFVPVGARRGQRLSTQAKIVGRQRPHRRDSIFQCAQRVQSAT
jgi:fermentation-respiration switch protein FrsA (DUF1100 family)